MGRNVRSQREEEQIEKQWIEEHVEAEQKEEPMPHLVELCEMFLVYYEVQLEELSLHFEYPKGCSQFDYFLALALHEQHLFYSQAHVFLPRPLFFFGICSLSKNSLIAFNLINSSYKLMIC